jgi:hypothetical protein
VDFTPGRPFLTGRDGRQSAQRSRSWSLPQRYDSYRSKWSKTRMVSSSGSGAPGVQATVAGDEQHTRDVFPARRLVDEAEHRRVVAAEDRAEVFADDLGRHIGDDLLLRTGWRVHRFTDALTELAQEANYWALRVDVRKVEGDVFAPTEGRSDR